MYVTGMFIQLLTDLKDLSRTFNMGISDILELPPFELQVIKSMLKRDVQQEQEKIGGGL